MLSEAGVQGLRGMAFDRLLLHAWPKPPPGSAARYGGCKGYDEILMARRIGTCRATLHRWRDGTQIPKLATIRLAAPNLESEFGVPAGAWLEAAYISGCAMGWVLNKPGREFIRNRAHAPASTRRLRAAEGLVGRQFGYWAVVSLAGTRQGNCYMYAKVRCLLCGGVQEKRLAEIKSVRSSRCRPCAARLRPPGAGRGSRYRGVYCRKKRSGRSYWGVGGERTPLPRRAFASETAAARYYDACMYERYGHTLFLNFPGEYDRSSDPVFVPADRKAKS